MARRRKRIVHDLDRIAADLARMIELKQRILDEGQRIGELSVALGPVDDLRYYTQMVRAVMEESLREGTLTDMPREEAQTAINFIRMFEDSLQVEDPSSHQ